MEKGGRSGRKEGLVERKKGTVGKQCGVTSLQVVSLRH